MTQTEYEQKKQECWKEYCTSDVPYDVESAFDFAFDRAYSLGKLQANSEQVNKTISQEETASQNQWIRVEDGLPEDRQRILYCYQSFYKGRYLTQYNTEIYYADMGFASGVIKQNLVLAWMPVAEFEIK